MHPLFSLPGKFHVLPDDFWELSPRYAGMLEHLYLDMLFSPRHDVLGGRDSLISTWVLQEQPISPELPDIGRYMKLDLEDLYYPASTSLT
jgi:hypothetical protein